MGKYPICSDYCGFSHQLHTPKCTTLFSYNVAHGHRAAYIMNYYKNVTLFIADQEEHTTNGRSRSMFIHLIGPLRCIWKGTVIIYTFLFIAFDTLSFPNST